MNILSLFDGMSCAQIALTELGIPIGKYYASEIDQHAIKQTQLNFPDTIQLGDVEKWRDWEIRWSKIDLICAGSPCFQAGTKVISNDGYKNIENNSVAGRVFTDKGKSVPLSALGGGGGAKTGLYNMENRIRRLTPLECARLQTVPDWYVWECSDTQAYRMLGNGWTIKVIEHIFKFLNYAK